MAIIECPNCRGQISDRARKCVHCGTVFISEEKKFCAECGAELEDGSVMCFCADALSEPIAGEWCQ